MTGAARRTDPSTSHQAAAGVDTTRMEGMVVRCLWKHGPNTADRVADLCGVEVPAITPRFRPLANKKMIRQKHDEDGNPVTATSLTSNKQRIVWELCATEVQGEMDV